MSTHKTRRGQPGRDGAPRSAAPFRRALLALLLAVGAGEVRAVPTCTAALSSVLSFGVIKALASTGDVTANSGSTFWINCTSDVSAGPWLYSATTRTLVSGGSNLPFLLSASSAGGTELASSPPGTAVNIPRDGNSQTVTLYGKLLNVNFRGLPSGYYSRDITLTVAY